ncbi:MAG: hypothetical protein V4510_01050 [bacterium]
MSRLLVGGHRDQLEKVIATLHAEGAVHIEDFKDPTGTTRIGTPLEAGDKASELLVAVRGLQKALHAEAAPAILEHVPDPSRLLGEARAATAAAVEKADALRSRLAAIDAEEQALAPVAGLDIDTGLLSSLSSVRVFLGTARSDPSAAVAAATWSNEMQVVAAPGGFGVALVVASKDASAAERILAENAFSPAALPPGMGTPSDRLTRLAAEEADLAGKLEATDAELAKRSDAWGPRLAGLERVLVGEVERTQVPLRFAVTDQTFHVEGWVPTSRVQRVENALIAACGDKLYIENLRDAPDAPAHHREAAGLPVAHATDNNHHGKDEHGDAGGHEHGTDAKDEPPVHLENPKLARPYEFLLGLLGKPRYHEIDPTKLMLLFFPLFFGFMVGDMAVGAVIVLVGILLKKHKVFGIGGPAVGRALVMGGVLGIVVGAFVFGEALGIHFVVSPEQQHEGDLSWENILHLHTPYDTEAHGFLYKTGGAAAQEQIDTITENDAERAAGFNVTEAAPATHANMLAPSSDIHLSLGGFVNLGYYSKIHDIQALLIWCVLIGLVHLILGFVLGIRNVYVSHGAALAIQEKAAWLFLMAGTAMAVLGLVTAMLPPWMGWLGVGLAVFSVALLWMAATKVLGAGFVALLEVPGLLGNLVSYTRLAAIGASKAGMAVALIAIAPGLADGNPVGWIIYVLGFACIIPLAILGAGLQSLRLQFVEFFQKFYTGGGRPYLPFGRRAA